MAYIVLVALIDSEKARTATAPRLSVTVKKQISKRLEQVISGVI